MTLGGCLLLRSLLGVKRTSLFAAHMSAFGPKRTWACAPLKKCHRADFDAFARPRMRRGGGILERGVRGPARAAVLHRIKYLEYIGLLAPHAREPVPLVFRIILDCIGLADASGRAPL